ncbi:MAG: PTS transporter subunit EIIC [Oscillospiraceae bacterium]|nr:PTS transporter subunit EIIC [Oscillospiraceae bacterium]
MAKSYPDIAKEIIDLIGGTDNISSVSHCMTRLHFTVKDKSRVRLGILETSPDVLKVVVANNQCQVVIGDDVADIYDEIQKEMERKPVQETIHGTRSLFMRFSALIDKVYLPFAGVFSAAGMLKGLTLMFVSLGVLQETSVAYTVLRAISEGILYFLPVFVSYTTAETFGANPYISMAVAAAFVHPEITSLLHSLGGEGSADLFGIPFKGMDYTTSAIPIFVAVLLQSKIEKGLKKILPSLVRDTLTLFLSLTVTSAAMFLVIGPVMNLVSDGIASAVVFLIGLSPTIAGMLFGAFYPVLIVLGLQWGLIPVYFAGIKANGYDNFMIFTVATNFILAGVALGVYLKSREKKMKEVSFAAFLSALIGGVTEPSIYNCTLKFKRPLVIVCCVDAVCGAVIGFTRTVQYSFVSWNLLSIPALVAGSSIYTLYMILFGFAASTALVYLFGYDDSMLEKET